MDNLLNISYIEWLNDDEELIYFKKLMSEIGLDITKRLNLYFISHLATNDDILDLAKYFNRVFYCQSYKHTKFTEEFVKEIQLGIIPGIIEKNISQSAIEFVSRKTPILCGNKGGECEFCNNQMFLFDTDNIDDFRTKLTRFIDEPSLLKQYWLDQNEVAVEFINQERMGVNI